MTQFTDGTSLLVIQAPQDLLQHFQDVSVEDAIAWIDGVSLWTEEELREYCEADIIGLYMDLVLDDMTDVTLENMNEEYPEQREDGCIVEFSVGYFSRGDFSNPLVARCYQYATDFSHQYTEGHIALFK